VGLLPTTLTLGLGAGLLCCLYAVLAARELGARTRVRWGWWLGGLLPVAGATAYLVTRRPATVSFAGDARAPWVAAGLVAFGLGVWAVAGWAGRVPKRAAALLAMGLVAVAALTWIPVQGGPRWSTPDGARWVECFTARYRWDVYSTFGSDFDALPNLALYVPVGAALIWAWRRWRGLAPLGAMALSFATESYQALVTDRECAASDMLVNLDGALLGMVLVVALEVGLPPRRHRSQRQR
jgi:hypothetical protein